MHFAEKVPSRNFDGAVTSPALTVTVTDLEGLTAALGGDHAEPPAAT